MFKTLITWMLLLPISLWGQIQVHGVVLDPNSEPIVGATVVVKGPNLGVVSSLNGKFEISCDSPCTLIVSHINYISQTTQLENSKVLNFILEPNQQVLDEIEIVSELSKNVTKSDLSKIEGMTALFGEKDILKYMITLPGISSISTFDAGISVRGSSTSENAFLINGMIISDPRHLTTLVTSYDPYVLANANIYKSGQPSKYNGHLAGYVDMSPQWLTGVEPQAELSVGLISSSIRAKSSLGKNNRHQLSISARQSYLHFIAEMYEKELEGTNILPDYSLRDLTLSYQGRLSKGWSVSGVGLWSSDDLPIVLNENQSHQLYWSTSSGVFSVQKKFDNYDELKIKISASEGEASDTAQGRILQSIRSKEQIISGAFLYDKALGMNWMLKSGVQYQSKKYDYFDDPDASDPSPKSAQRAYGLTNMFSSIEYQFKNTTITGGLNLAWFNGDANHFNISPRFKIHHLSNWEFWADYARTLQYEERLPFFTIRSPIDMPIPLGDDNSPAVSDQISVGSAKEILNGLNLSTGLFYKRLTNVKDFANNSRSNLDFISIEMIEGSGHAYGLESEMVYHRNGLLTRVSYTMLQSKRQFAAINDEEEFSPPYDITNSITLQSTYSFNDNWRIGALWTYTSGIYITIPEGIAVAKDITRSGSVANYVPIYGERYNYRLPPRHRLDLSLDYFKKLGKNAMKVSAGTYNTYGRDNIDFVYLEVQQADEYLIRFVPKSKLVLPFVPYVSFTFYLNNHGDR